MAAEREILAYVFDTVKIKFPQTLGPHSWYLVAVNMPLFYTICLLVFGHRVADEQPLRYPPSSSIHHPRTSANSGSIFYNS